MIMNSPASFLQRRRSHTGAGQEGVEKGFGEKTVECLQSRGSRSACNKVVASELLPWAEQ